MALTSEQRRQLEELRRLEKEPEKPPPAISFTLDLSDDKAYERAVKLGLVDEPADDSGSDDSEDREADETPRRRSYFGD